MFFGVIPKRPLSNRALAMLLRRMNVDATAHGFRTSFRTWCSDVAHAPFEVAEACLSHRIGSAVSRAYARSRHARAPRPIMQAWADFLTEADRHQGRIHRLAPEAAMIRIALTAAYRAIASMLPEDGPLRAAQRQGGHNVSSTSRRPSLTV